MAHPKFLPAYAIVYLAGPMRGFPQSNFPAFAEARKALRSKGFTVWCPAEEDLRLGYDPVTGEGGEDFAAYMARDLPQVCNADAVVVLPGWEKSDGARGEMYVADLVGSPVYRYPDLSLVDFKASPSVPGGETRVVNAATGGVKGQKMERYDLIPWRAMDEVARLYGEGAKKYEDNNWRRGYAWSLSFAAMLRHAVAWWKGESRDSGTGCHHLSSVVFHALAQMEFELSHPELDDRPRVEGKPNPIYAEGIGVESPSSTRYGDGALATAGSNGATP